MDILEYKDSVGDTQRLDEYSVHELTDRIHLLMGFWEDVINTHHAGYLVKEQTLKIEAVMFEAYQFVANLSFDNFTQK